MVFTNHIKCGIFALLVGGACASSVVAVETLASDYEARLEELEANISGIDSTTNPTNYVEWICSAVEAKQKLKQRNSIAWLDELTATHTNNWKILHAVARGCASVSSDETIRWKTIVLMDQAYRLAQQQDISQEELCFLTEDYIDLLLVDRAYAPYLLSTQTRDQSEADTTIYQYPLRNEEKKLFFFDCPESYEAASNDGELIRWLIQKTLPDSYWGERWLSKRGMADFAVMLAGTHRIISSTSTYGREILSPLKDHEALTVTPDHEPLVVQLPEAYRYIQTYRELADEGDQNAANTLGNIFFNRYQFENAAHYYEKGGSTDEARSIRANYGEIIDCPAQAANCPASFDYAFRNGTELQIQIFRYSSGTNLLERLKAGNVDFDELQFLTGDSRSPAGPTIRNHKVAEWTATLHPEADHQDSMQQIELPPLPAGNYRVHAKIKDGNSSEHDLLLNDTLVLLTKIQTESSTNWNYAFHFCDTATGEPLMNKEFFLVKQNQNTNPDRILRGRTNRNGLYVFDEWELSQLKDTLLLIDHKDRGLIAVRVPYDPGYYGYNNFEKRDFPSAQKPLFSTTDRPVYRPGDSGFLKVATGPSPRPVELEIKKSNSTIPFVVDGAENSSLMTEPDLYGGANGRFTIPDDIAPGTYTISETSENQTTLTRLVVAEHAPPKLRLSAELFDSGKITLTAIDAEGKPIPNIEVNISLSFSPQPRGSWCPKNMYDDRLGRGFWWHGGQFQNRTISNGKDVPDLNAKIKINTDINGCLSINLADVDAMNFLYLPGWFNLHTEVIFGKEDTLKEWIKVPSLVQRRPLCCWLDKAFYESSERIECHVAAEYPIDQIALELNRISSSSVTLVGQYPVEGDTVSFGQLPAGLYEARAVAGEQDSKPFRFTVLGAPPVALSPEHPLRITREKGAYKPGEFARLLIQTDRPGRYVHFISETLDQGNASFLMDSTERVINLPIPDESNAYYFAKAMVVEKGEPYFYACVIPLIDSSPQTGSVSITPNQNTYSSGENVRIAFQVSDASGKARPSSIAVSVYNADVDRLEAARNAKTTKRSRIPFSATSSLYVEMFDNWPTHDPIRYPSSRLMNHPYFQGGLPFTQRTFAQGDYLSFDADWQPRAHNFRCYKDESLNVEPDQPSSPLLEPIVDPCRTAYWNPTMKTDENGQAVIEFPMPDDAEDWKISAWAIGTNFTATGEAIISLRR